MGGGGGSSTWSNVEVTVVSGSGANWTWYEIGCDTTQPKAVHYWYSSKLTGAQSGSLGGGYQTCSENWFLGSEISTIIDPNGGGSKAAAIVSLAGNGVNGDVRLFGSVVRILVPSSAASINLTSVRAIQANGTGASVNKHGGLINVDASASTQSYGVSAVRVDNGGAVRILDTAFSVKAPPAAYTSSVKRIEIGPSGGTVAAPFLWDNGTTLPNITSTTGADLLVETDCNAAGACSGSGTETHLMIYNGTCSSKWWDVNKNACRP